MPRKVTKTMRKMRKIAMQKSRARTLFRQEKAAQEFHWGVDHFAGGETEVIVRVAKERPKTDSVSITLDFSNDFSKLEERVASNVNLSGTSTGRFTTPMESDANIPKGTVTGRILTDAEYAEREALAQQEILRKKSCVAPAYNKGAYQYIASEEQAKDAGKK